MNRILTEQERCELRETLKIPSGGYKHREQMLRKKLEEQTTYEEFRVLDIFPDKIFFQTKGGIFEAQYSLDEQGEVELAEIVKVNETVERLEERFRGAMKKKLLELEMAGLSPKSSKSKLLLEQRSIPNERTLTERQIKDRRIAGLE